MNRGLELPSHFGKEMLLPLFRWHYYIIVLVYYYYGTVLYCTL